MSKCDWCERLKWLDGVGIALSLLLHDVLAEWEESTKEDIVIYIHLASR